MEQRPLLPGVEALLSDEELRAARILNRFRYLIVALFILPLVVQQMLFDLVAAFRNSVALFILFLSLTVLQTWILSGDRKRWIQIFNFLMITVDFFAVVYQPLFFTLTVSPDNFAYLFKNSTLNFGLLVVVYTALQLRRSLLWYATGLFLLFHAVCLAWALIRDVLPLTQDWRLYLLGDRLHLFQWFYSVPVVMLFVAIVLGRLILRVRRLIENTARVEVEKASLARYFSPTIAAEILERPGVLERARRLPVTVLFCDIRDFTSFSERTPPEALVSFLEHFRTLVTREIFDRRGTIDKFLGDGILAVFGLPEPAPGGQDARHAVESALAMFSRIEEWNRRRAAAGEPPVRIGIGLHAGEALVGNIASGTTVEYSVVGDTVNTAARIEGLCKETGSKLIVSESVYSSAKDLLPATELPEQLLRGKAVNVRLFALPEGRPAQGKNH